MMKQLVFLLLFFLAAAGRMVHGQQQQLQQQQQIITGHIISCSGWALNKLPALKSFLTSGEAEGYQGITLEYIGGKEPTLTIYKKKNKHSSREEEQEEVINLRPYDTNAQLHELMVSKGFVPKSPEERELIRQEKMEKMKQELLKKELHRVHSHIYYEKEKFYVENFQKDVMGGLMEDTNAPSSIRGGRGASFYLNENYRRMKAEEYFQYTGNKPLPEHVIKEASRNPATIHQPKAKFSIPGINK